MKRKCPACARKIERKFSYCPYCGVGFKGRSEKGDFGMLGIDDSGEEVEVEQKLPFGMEKIMNSLIGQLERQMNNMNASEGMPRGFQVRISRGSPQGRVVQAFPEKKAKGLKVSDEENERRMGLVKVDAKSRVRRLGDRIVYEIEAPGIRRKEDVVLTKLATGLEIKAYSDERCYVKFIPLTVEVIGYGVRGEKVVVELKS